MERLLNIWNSEEPQAVVIKIAALVALLALAAWVNGGSAPTY